MAVTGAVRLARFNGHMFSAARFCVSVSAHVCVCVRENYFQLYYSCKTTLREIHSCDI